MEITEISVEIGETRNHPFVHGNYRASVRLTAVVEAGEDYRDVTRDLRGMARLQVIQECDEWEDQVREERRVAGILADIRAGINRVKNYGSTIQDVQRDYELIRQRLFELPEDMLDDWLDKIGTAFEERCNHIEQAQSEEE